MLEFLDADFTFVNELLAQHYGIADVHGDAMQRIRLQDSKRGGLLTQASILRITSGADDTSPVRRGKWVLETLLGAAPIRPPADILRALDNPAAGSKLASFRKQVEAHAANPACAQCHARIDAIGLALENYDQSGAWRIRYLNKQPVEAIGVMPDGIALDGPAGMKTFMKKNREQFVRTLGERLLGHALGRKLDERDRLALANLPRKAADHDFRFSGILLEVVQSAAFQRVHGD